MIKKGYIQFWRKMTPYPKKWSRTTKFFLKLFFRKMLLSSKKLSDEIFKTLLPINKRLYSLSSPDALFPSKGTGPPEIIFCPFFRK